MKATNCDLRVYGQVTIYYSWRSLRSDGLSIIY